MSPRLRVAIRQARKLICPAERNMLREMYNFDRHAARELEYSYVFYLYKLSYVVIVKTKDKSHWAVKIPSAYDLLPIFYDHVNYKTNNSGQHI
jgi:hypothetical protein